jgi:hypothetical protein
LGFGTLYVILVKRLERKTEGGETGKQEGDEDMMETIFGQD